MKNPNSLNNNQITSQENFFQKIYRIFSNLLRSNPQVNDRDLNSKLNETFNYYSSYYKNEVNYHVQDPFNSKTGLINLLNDCYMITFLQILFHTPNFINILRSYNKNGDEIIDNLISVSEYPFNAGYFYKLKQSLGAINPEYSKPMSNDSQEFGIDLINYLISVTKEPIYENNNEIDNKENIDFIQLKKIVYEKYISTYQKKVNELEKLFLWNQIDIFCGQNFKNPTVSSNLHLELTLQKNQDCVELEKLIENKYSSDNSKISQNQIVINSKIASLPEILIISINRVLNNNRYINTTRLLFKETLDLKKYIDFDLFEDENEKTTYQLYAVNECFHNYRTSHYKCYIKLENKWFIFDDDKRVEEFRSHFHYSPFIVGIFYRRDH